MKTAGEAVNGLGRVAHHAQVAVLAQPQLEQLLLQRADVLVLIDHQMPVRALHLGADVVVVAEQGHCAQQHVVEVDHPAIDLELFVAGVDAAHPRGIDGGHLATLGQRDLGIVGRRHVTDLGPADLGQQVAQGAGFDPLAQLSSGRLGHQPEALIADPRQFGAHRPGPEVLGLTQGGGMERARLHPRVAEAAQPPTQLAGRPCGERDGQHRERVVGAGGAAVGDAVGDGAGLAGACAGYYAHGYAERGRDGPLFGVESGQQLIGLRHPAHCRGPHPQRSVTATRPPGGPRMASG